MTKATPPTLAMLWEDDDPTEALAGRFGFRDPGVAADWIAATLDKHWGLAVDACDRVIISSESALAWVGTGSAHLVVKWSVRPEHFDRLGALAGLSAWLDDRGLPVAAPIPSSSGDLQVETDRSSLSLQREIVGDLLDPTDLTQAHAAGRALAQLHASLARYPHPSRLRLDDRPIPLASRVSGWLDSDLRGVTADARQILRQLIQNAPPSHVPPQVVHGDFRSANVLWADGQIAAILDLEEARWDHPVDELARSAVLLGTRYRDWGPVSREIRHEFLNGYQCVRPLDPAEMTWWSILVLWDSLRMTPPSGDDPTGWAASAEAQVEELRRTP